ncbi:MAG: M1 family metallopeptidase [Planctomycetota bacterium]
MALRHARALLALLATSAATIAAQTGPVDDGRSSEANYVIRARVDDAEPSEFDDGPQKTLTGTLELTWKNGSGEEVSDLWFHLYLNAYANNKSLHLTEARGKLRGVDIERGYGWQDVRSVRVGETDLTDAVTYRVTQGEAPFDRTLFSVDLAEPVPPGGEVTVEIEWESRLPRVRRRTGTKGNFIFLSHWFPKLAVYERGRGWRAHPFHMNTEFYADYGTYDVTLDLPAEYDSKVAASGTLAGVVASDPDRHVTRWVAPAPEDQVFEDPVAARGSGLPPRVHGFAWTADPDYVVFEQPFRWDEWAARHELDVSETMRALDLDASELAGREVLVRVMVQPERAGQAERHWHATCAALFFYGLWYGPYPYAELTAVDPAWGARAAGGMEYPTLFTCGTRMFTKPQMYSPESVTVHEAGHQFWYGLVGNNEPEAAWLDEGLNSFTDSETLFRVYGPRRASTSYSALPVWGKAPTAAPSNEGLAGALSLQSFEFTNPIRFALDRAGVEVGEDVDWLVPTAIEARPLQASPFVRYWRDQPLLSFVEELSDPRWGDRSSYLRDPDSDPIETVVWDYVDRTSYGTNSYARPAVSLRSLQAVVGRDAFLSGMRRFAEEWRYRHPYPEDFYLSFQEGAGVDVQWYFDDVFRDTKTVDWSCEVEQTREPEKEGWFRCEDGSWTAECGPEEPVALEGDDDSDDDEADDETERPWMHDVVLRRRGDLFLPVKVRVTMEEGETLDFDWTREMQFESNWWRLPLVPGPEKVASVVIDPDRLWFLDTNMSNNQWFDESDALAAPRWGERVAARAINVLHWFMAVGG